MTLPAPKIEIDDENAALLARLDAHGTEERKLLQIFSCTAEELKICREVEAYKAAHSAEVLELERRAALLDDSWDAVEEKALGDYLETAAAGGIVDPRMLLQAASTANKMSRRNAGQSTDGLARQKAKEGVTLNAQQPVVIRLRTKFVSGLNTPAGHQQLIEREAEIAGTPEKIADELGAGDVRRHLTESLNIDLDSLKSGGASQPDTPLEEMLQTTFMEEGPSGETRTPPGDRPSDMFAKTLTQESKNETY